MHDLTSGLPLVTPKISFKPSIRVAPAAYVAPAAKSCFTAYRLLIREKVNARNLTLWRQEQRAIKVTEEEQDVLLKSLKHHKWHDVWGKKWQYCGMYLDKEVIGDNNYLFIVRLNCACQSKVHKNNAAI